MMRRTLILCFIFISGCMTFPEVSRISSASYPAKDASASILLRTSDYADKKYEEIAVINIRSGSMTHVDQLNESLKQKARELGADAIIRIQYGHEGMWGNPTATGTAVKFID